MTPGASERSDDESALVVEARADAKWLELTSLGPSVPPGSISHNGPGGRQVYVFRCCGGYSVLQRSKAGGDVTHGDLRVLSSSGLEVVARLTPEESTADFWLRPDGKDEPVRFRFRHEPPLHPPSPQP